MCETGKLFVNRILSTLRKAPDKGYVTLDQGFAKDIAWFNQFKPIKWFCILLQRITNPHHHNVRGCVPYRYGRVLE